MDRHNVINNPKAVDLFETFNLLHQELDSAFKQQYDRSLPFADEVLDRWERAKKLGFGDESSIYDSSYVFGKVTVGKKTWIGPFTIIDGSGGLAIGDHCTISTGVQIYTHDNVAQTLTGGVSPIERQPVTIGNFTYIGPNSIIKKGVSIGDHCIIGTNSFITHSIPSNSVVVGTPGQIIGTTRIEKDKLIIDYFNRQTSEQKK